MRCITQLPPLSANWRGLAALLCAIWVSGCGSSNNSSDPIASSSSSQSSSSSSVAAITKLSTDGSYWVNSQGDAVVLRGTNLGNWLLQEFWMMGQSTDQVDDQCTLESLLDERFGRSERTRLMTLFRDNWITTRDWDLMADFGLNVVRLPFIWNLIEDEDNPYTLRDNAWHYLDLAIDEAEARNMYVILDLHGAVGSQGWEHHSGCSERNWYWDGGNGEPAEYYQNRTIWLWEQIAERYKDRDSIAGYGLLNEPWGTDPETLAEVITTLYHQVRAIDPDRVIILPGHSAGIDAYGHPTDRGMSNVAFEMHFYPGIFGWGTIGYGVHRDWLTCGPDGNGGVCEWDQRLTQLDTPFLIGEFQPWTGLGLELGAQINRATYDTYASYGWAATNWAYKVLTNTGGQGAGTWGMVTNQPGLGLLTKADTWACAGWDSTFDNACGTTTPEITIPGEGEQTYYLAIKAGTCCDGNLDVSIDSVALVHTDSHTNLIENGEFGSDAGWSHWAISGNIHMDFNTEATDLLPQSSHGPVLRLTGAAESNGGIYQKVVLTGGDSYSFSGVFRDNGSANAWAEIYLVPEQPQDTVDITGAVLPQLDFATASLADIEALFEAFGSIDYDVHEPLMHWLTSAESPDLFNLPEPPSGLTLTTLESGHQLDWAANTESGISGYRIYRSTVADALGEAIAEVQTTTYLDNSAGDQTAYYRVSALAGLAESYTGNTVATALTATPVPGRVQAQHYSAMSGIQLETTNDTGGSQNIGFVDPGDWLEYLIHIDSAGTYTIDYRLASETGSPGFHVRIGDTTLDTVVVPATGGWQSWQTLSAEIELPEGEHTLRLDAIGGSWNLNWMEIRLP